jgi:hypothetical protein
MELINGVAADCSSNRSGPSAFDHAKASAPMAPRHSATMASIKSRSPIRRRRACRTSGGVLSELLVEHVEPRHVRRIQSTRHHRFHCHWRLLAARSAAKSSARLFSHVRRGGVPHDALIAPYAWADDPGRHADEGHTIVNALGRTSYTPQPQGPPEGFRNPAQSASESPCKQIAQAIERRRQQAK